MEGRQTHPTTPAVSHSSHPYPSEFLPPRLQCDAAGVGVLSVLFSTGSPFGHHPRLSMVRLRRRREYLCVDAAEEERWYEHLQTYAICKGGDRRNASTCSPTVPRGDTPCVTAGDAQRANPWKVDKPTLRTGGVAQQPPPIHIEVTLFALAIQRYRQ